ncbi:hypothetical protein GCM10023065_02010 [Microbacterium laevaniformans]|nr:hypothetical protein GCM10017578_27240 [Microbacterium laevaniformans]
MLGIDLDANRLCVGVIGVLDQLDKRLGIVGDQVFAQLEEHGRMHLEVQLGDIAVTGALKIRQRVLLSIDAW